MTLWARKMSPFLVNFFTCSPVNMFIFRKRLGMYMRRTSKEEVCILPKEEMEREDLLHVRQI